MDSNSCHPFSLVTFLSLFISVLLLFHSHAVSIIRDCFLPHCRHRHRLSVQSPCPGRPFIHPYMRHRFLYPLSDAAEVEEEAVAPDSSSSSTRFCGSGRQQQQLVGTATDHDHDPGCVASGGAGAAADQANERKYGALAYVHACMPACLFASNHTCRCCVVVVGVAWLIGGVLLVAALVQVAAWMMNE